jgi:mono/diheme cytochrome c family protein
MAKKRFCLMDEIQKNPIAALGIAYPYFIAAVVVAGVYYITTIDAVYENKLEPYLPDSTLMKTAIDVKKPSVSEPVELDVWRGDPSAELMTLGEEEYAAVCQSCHGATGEGDGAAGAGLDPAPRDFTAADGWTRGRTIVDLYTTTQEGVEGTGMVAYDYLDARAKVALVRYIRAEFMSDPPEITEEEIQTLDAQYKLSQGDSVAGRIPVEVAAALVSQDRADVEALAAAALRAIESERAADQTAALVFDLFDDPERATLTLAKRQTWRRDYDEFVALLALAPETNGFGYRALATSEETARELWRYLSEMYANQQAAFATSESSENAG